MLETERLVLRHFNRDDAAFILRLLNEPAWLEHIGDRGVRTLEDARNYIQKGPVEMYGRLGFGLFLVELKEGAVPLGLCGLIKREGLDHVDIGFAFLAEHRGKGYAFESASAVMSWARDVLRLPKVLAITSQGNSASGRLLEKLGFRYKGLVHLGGEDLKLYENGGRTMNPVVHFEMPYDERERMAKFYESAFGWQMQMLGEEMGNYVLATTTETDETGPKKPGAINGGFFSKKPDWPGQHPSVVIAVDDIQEAMGKVMEAGGTVLGEPIDMPGVGQYVAFTDTEGNRVSMLQPIPRNWHAPQTE